MAEKKVYSGIPPSERRFAGVPVLGGLEAAYSYLSPTEYPIIQEPQTTYTEDMGQRYATTSPGIYGEPRPATPAVVKGILDFVKYLKDDPKEAATAIGEGIASIPKEQLLGAQAMMEGADYAYDPDSGEEFRLDPFLVTGPVAAGTVISAAKAAEQGSTILGAGPADLARRLRIGKGGIRGLAHGVKSNDLLKIDPDAAEEFFDPNYGPRTEDLLFYRGGYDLGGKEITVSDLILHTGFSNRARRLLAKEGEAASAEVKRPGFSMSRDPYLSYSSFTGSGGATAPVTEYDFEDLLVVVPKQTAKIDPRFKEKTFTAEDLVLDDIENLSPSAYVLKAYNRNKHIQLKPNTEYYEDELHLGGASGAGVEVRRLSDREKQDVTSFIEKQQDLFNVLKAARVNRPSTTATGEVSDRDGFIDHARIMGSFHNNLQSPVLRRPVENELMVLANWAYKNKIDGNFLVNVGEENRIPESFLQKLADISQNNPDSPFDVQRHTNLRADLEDAYRKAGNDAVDRNIIQQIGEKTTLSKNSVLGGAKIKLGSSDYATDARGSLHLEPDSDLIARISFITASQDNLKNTLNPLNKDMPNRDALIDNYKRKIESEIKRLDEFVPAWKLFYQIQPDPDLGINVLKSGVPDNHVEIMVNDMIRKNKTELRDDDYYAVGAYRRKVAEEIASKWPQTAKELEFNVDKLPEARAFNELHRQKRVLVDDIIKEASELFPMNLEARIAISPRLSEAMDKLEDRRSSRRDSFKGAYRRKYEDSLGKQARELVKEETKGPRKGAVLYKEGGIVTLADVARNTGRGPMGVASLASTARNMNRPMVS